MKEFLFKNRHKASNTRDAIQQPPLRHAGSSSSPFSAPPRMERENDTITDNLNYSTPCNLMRFPNELFIHILSYIPPTEYYVLLSVCREWRNVLLVTPQVWSDVICIAREPGDRKIAMIRYRKRLEYLLEMCQGYLRTLNVICPEWRNDNISDGLIEWCAKHDLLEKWTTFTLDLRHKTPSLFRRLLEQVARSTQKGKGLRNLTVRDTDELNDLNFDLLHAFTALESLDLTGCKEVRHCPLKQNANLVKLVLSNCNLTDNGLQNIVGACPALVHLDVRDNWSLTSGGLHKLQALEFLVNLWLSRPERTPQMSFTRVFTTWPRSMHSFGLFSISENELPALIYFLKRSVSTLHTLEIVDTPFPTSDISWAISACTNLVKLVLQSCTGVSIIMLNMILRDCTRLQILDISKVYSLFRLPDFISLAPNLHTLYAHSLEIIHAEVLFVLVQLPLSWQLIDISYCPRIKEYHIHEARRLLHSSRPKAKLLYRRAPNFY